MKMLYFLPLTGLMLLSCEILDDDVDKHASDRAAVSLSEVAQVLANIPFGVDQMGEVFGAVSSSAENGYDEEYMMYDLFSSSLNIDCCDKVSLWHSRSLRVAGKTGRV